MNVVVENFCATKSSVLDFCSFGLVSDGLVSSIPHICPFSPKNNSYASLNMAKIAPNTYQINTVITQSFNYYSSFLLDIHRPECFERRSERREREKKKGNSFQQKQKVRCKIMMKKFLISFYQRKQNAHSIEPFTKHLR